MPEINKPAKVPCKNLRKQGYGCTIYEDRPSACRKYKCSWLRGLGTVEDQPDTSHVLIDRRMTQWGVVLVAKQLRPFAAMTKKGKNAISHAAQDQNVLCLVVDFENTDKVIGAAGPKLIVERFKKDTGEQPVVIGGAEEYVSNLVQQIGRGQCPAM